MIDQPEKKCPYCGQPMTTVHNQKITDRSRDPITRRAYVRTRVLQFCSPKCGGNYQMGCEG
ncbi:eL24 family ribosomal protein [Paraburkholderia fungorum]|uniref:hypothetical protein n=1 Tax=Paraburkholderia fungorum TaxID=134537 RepID=UPI0038B9AD1B